MVAGEGDRSVRAGVGAIGTEQAPAEVDGGMGTCGSRDRICRARLDAGTAAIGAFSAVDHGQPAESFDCRVTVSVKSCRGGSNLLMNAFGNEAEPRRSIAVF